MHFDDDGLKAEDHAYRRAAETYFDEKIGLARECFEPKQLETFRSFEEHWREFFAPPEAERQREYLATPFEVRKNQFERFTYRGKHVSQLEQEEGQRKVMDWRRLLTFPVLLFKII